MIESVSGGVKAGYQEYSRPCAIQVQTTNTRPSRASIFTKYLIAQSTSFPLRKRSSLVARQKPTIGWSHHRYFLCPDSSLIRRSSQFLISVSSRDISRTRDWSPAFLSSGDRLDGEAHSQFARLNVKIRGPDCISRLTKEERTWLGWLKRTARRVNAKPGKMVENSTDPIFSSIWSSYCSSPFRQCMSDCPQAVQTSVRSCIQQSLAAGLWIVGALGSRSTSFHWTGLIFPGRSGNFTRYTTRRHDLLPWSWG